jgi:predicted PurR-regulated permease PerM
MKRLALQAAVILATLAVALALWQMREAVVVLAFSVLLAAAVEPLVDAVAARRVPRHLAVVLVYLAGLSALGLLVWLSLGSIVDELQRGVDDLSAALARIHESWPRGNVVQRSIATALENVRLSKLGGATLTSLATGLLGVTVNVFQAVAAVLIVLILSVYWTVSQASFERLALSIFPSEHRPTARDTWEDVKAGAGGRLRRIVVQSALAILALEVGFHAMGLRYATIPALVVGLLRGLPVGRLAVASALAVATGLATSAVLGVCAGVYTLAVLVLLRDVLGPRLFQGRDYSSFVLVVTVLALLELFGVVGLFVAPAVAAAVEILGEHLLSDKKTRAAGALEREDLDQRLVAIKALLAEHGEPAPELVSLVERLSTLIEDADAATRRGVVPWRRAA